MVPMRTKCRGFGLGISVPAPANRQEMRLDEADRPCSLAPPRCIRVMGERRRRATSTSIREPRGFRYLHHALETASAVSSTRKRTTEPEPDNTGYRAPASCSFFPHRGGNSEYPQRRTGDEMALKGA